MRLFVTGGTGFIGGHFIKSALGHGHTIVALRRNGSNAKIALPPEVEWYESQLDEVSDDVLASCDALVHLAAQGVSPQPTNWLTAFEVNVKQSMALIAQSERLGISHIIACGSCFEYGLSGARYDRIPPDATLEPVGPYAASKAAFSVALAAFSRSSNNAFTLLRPFHLYGEGQESSNFWPSLKRAALSGEDFHMTAGEQIRDYMAVEDAADQFVDALNSPPLPGKLGITNIGSGKPITLRAFAEQWWEHWGAAGKLVIGVVPYRDNEVMRFVPKI